MNYPKFGRGVLVALVALGALVARAKEAPIAVLIADYGHEETGFGDTLQATLSWRDFQGDSRRQVVDIPIDPSWVGRNLEVVLALH